MLDLFRKKSNEKTPVGMLKEAARTGDVNNTALTTILHDFVECSHLSYTYIAKEIVSQAQDPDSYGNTTEFLRYIALNAKNPFLAKPAFQAYKDILIAQGDMVTEDFEVWKKGVLEQESQKPASPSADGPG